MTTLPRTITVVAALYLASAVPTLLGYAPFFRPTFVLFAYLASILGGVVGALVAVSSRSRATCLIPILALAVASPIALTPGVRFAFPAIVHVPLTFFYRDPDGLVWRIGFDALPVMMAAFLFTSVLRRTPPAQDVVLAEVVGNPSTLQPSSDNPYASPTAPLIVGEKRPSLAGAWFIAIVSGILVSMGIFYVVALVGIVTTVLLFSLPLTEELMSNPAFLAMSVCGCLGLALLAGATVGITMFRRRKRLFDKQVELWRERQRLAGTPPHEQS